MNTFRVRLFFSFWLSIIFFVEIFLIATQISAKPNYYVYYSKYSERGLILDRNGKDLVLNTKRKSLALNPKIINKNERKKIISILSKKLNLSEEDLAQKFTQNLEFIWIKRMLSQEEYNKISNYIDGKKLFIIEEPYRSYPLKLGTSNLLGFVGVDIQGLYGLEAFLDHYLKQGSNVFLTIDKNLQEVVSSYLKDYVQDFEAEGGFIGILDLNTGEILSLASLPDIDLNKSLSDLIVQSKKVKSPLYSLYEPGSLFKIVTAGIALEEKIADPFETIFCKGEEINDGYKVRCTEVHGNVNLREAIIKSCNIYFYHLSQKIPFSIWEKYLKLLGIYEKVPLDVELLVKDYILPDFKNSVITKSTMGFGHGLALNPVKMLWVFSCFGNDGFLIRPKLIKKMEKVKENKNLNTKEESLYRQVFSRETTYEILNYMTEVIKKGTANNISYLKYNIAGKTGTAQVSTAEGYLDQYNHFFVGYLFLGEKKYCILIMLESPKKGRFARETVVPLFGEIVKRLAIYGRMIN